MAQLSKILGSILRDMVAAQHEANMYALKLASTYRNQSQAAALNPPLVSLGEVELMLHCGFTGEAVESEVYEVDQTLVLATVQELSSEISEVVVSGILSTIVNREDDGLHEEGPMARLNREKTARRNFVAFLGHRLYAYLKAHRAEFVAPDGPVDQEVLQEAILFVTDDQILSHPELEEVFEQDPSGGLRKKVRENLQANVGIMLPRILKNVQIGRPRRYSSLDVTVSSEELSRLPDECIQTFRLKISPRDLLSEADTE